MNTWTQFGVLVALIVLVIFACKLRVRPSIVNRTLRLLGILLLGMGASFPAAHLLKIAQINGWVPGPTPEIRVITDRAPLSTGDYWGPEGGLAWGPHDEWRKGENVIYVSARKYESVALGDKIEIRRFPGDPLPHTSGENYVSSGNLTLNACLLAPLLIGMILLFFFELRSLEKILAGR